MDAQARSLDREILAFIRRFSHRHAPETAFNALALKIFAFQYERNFNYRRFCDLSASQPASVKRWQDIPAMPAAGFKDLVLSTFTPKNAKVIFRTSGTRQKDAGPSANIGRGAHLFETLELYEASIVPAFQKALLSDRAKLDYFFLMASPKEAPDSSLSHMMGVVNRRFAKGKGRFYIQRGELLSERLIRDLKKSKNPVFILATAFSLKAFLDALESKSIKFKLKAGSRLMETGGFKGRTHEISKKTLYALCGRLLGIPANFCFSEYGMTELSSQYYAKAGDVFTAPAWMKTQVVDPQSGKPLKKGRGLLCHYDLANRGSVLGVQTEDLGRVTKSGFKFIGRAKGAALRGCSLNYERHLGRMRGK